MRFSDGKAPEALRTIGEVSAALGIRQHVLRYWEEQFPQLRPVKRSGGRRYYRPADVALIARIDQLVHREGYTLKGAAKALREQDTESPAGLSVPSAQIDAKDAQLAKLRMIRASLSAAIAAA